MRLRVVPLIAGLLMIVLGVGVIGTADRMGDKIIYALTLLGCLGGAAVNAARYRRSGRVTTWRHVANGGWLGGVMLATTLGLLTGNPGAVGEAFGAAAGLGLIDGYGLGLVCAGLGVFEHTSQAQTT